MAVAWNIICVLGLTSLCRGATVAPTTADPTATSNNSTNTTGVNVVPIPYSQLDDQIKPAVTIGAMAVFVIIGFIIAKIVDRWYDRKEPSENASDCSEKTRELLRARFAMAAFEDLENVGANNVDDEDDGISEVITGRDKEPIAGEAAEASGGATGGEAAGAGGGLGASKKLSKMWMLKTAIMGEKRKRGDVSDNKAPADPAPLPPSNDDPPNYNKEQKVYTLPYTKDAKGDAPKNKKDDFIDVQFTHHRVEESFTISKRVAPVDLPEGENPYMYKYRHVSEDVLIPVRMMSPGAAAAAAGTAGGNALPVDMAQATSPDNPLPKLGYYAELTLAPTRLGHYADSDFGSSTSLGAPDKANDGNALDLQSSTIKGEKAGAGSEQSPGKATGVVAGTRRGKSPSPTKRRAHFSTDSGDSQGKHTHTVDGDRYEDDFESVSTSDNHQSGSNKRIQTGKTDKTDYSYMSGPATGTSMPSVDTAASGGTPRDADPLTSVRRQVQTTGASSDNQPETPRQFSKTSTKDRGKAKQINVQPRI